jgi:hypothetical protein
VLPDRLGQPCVDFHMACVTLQHDFYRIYYGQPVKPTKNALIPRKPRLTIS